MAQRAPAFQPQFDHVVDRYLNPLPRTIGRNGRSLLLDGVWHFELDLANRGLEEQWEAGHFYTRTTNWPGSIESQLQAGLALPWDDEVVAWYERSFELPDAWQGELVQVTFGAVGYETRVWLNGTLLHTVEGEPVHVGEFTSFSYELPRDLLQPVNRLTVRIADSLDAEIPRGKQASRIYKRGGIWYQTTSGALRSVWLEVVERNRLRSYLGVNSQIESNVVTFDFTTRVYDPGTYSLELVVQPAMDDRVLVGREWPLQLDAGAKHQHVSVVIPNAECWEPRSPVLYRVTAQLIGRTAVGLPPVVQFFTFDGYLVDREPQLQRLMPIRLAHAMLNDRIGWDTAPLNTTGEPRSQRTTCHTETNGQQRCTTTVVGINSSQAPHGRLFEPRIVSPALYAFSVIVGNRVALVDNKIQADERQLWQQLSAPAKPGDNFSALMALRQRGLLPTHLQDQEAQRIALLVLELDALQQQMDDAAFAAFIRNLAFAHPLGGTPLSDDVLQRHLKIARQQMLRTGSSAPKGESQYATADN